eukprot:TRINITY_DN28208_c0_g1_i1.p1 TRINITY_DN28208_c0_g1~~TRINITY_DN28208_c0_g1_i1.p1  ORF type:complete len:334 (+),score=55.25 TRINITY_DN28208_c0_g1_i1:232-1233(+)
MLKLLRDEWVVFLLQAMQAMHLDFSLPEMSYAARKDLTIDAAAAHLNEVIAKYEELAKTGRGLNLRPLSERTKSKTMPLIDARTQEDTPPCPTATATTMAATIASTTSSTDDDASLPDLISLDGYVEEVHFVAPGDDEDEDAEDEEDSITDYNDTEDSLVENEVTGPTGKSCVEDASPDMPMVEQQLLFLRAVGEAIVKQLKKHAANRQSVDETAQGAMVGLSNREVEGLFSMLRAETARCQQIRGELIASRLTIRLGARMGFLRAAARLQRNDPGWNSRPASWHSRVRGCPRSYRGEQIVCRRWPCIVISSSTCRHSESSPPIGRRWLRRTS